IASPSSSTSLPIISPSTSSSFSKPTSSQNSPYTPITSYNAPLYPPKSLQLRQARSDRPVIRIDTGVVSKCSPTTPIITVSPAVPTSAHDTPRYYLGQTYPYHGGTLSQPLTIISFAKRPHWSTVGKCDEKSIWVQFIDKFNGAYTRIWHLLPRDHFDTTRPPDPPDPPSFFDTETLAPPNILHHARETWRSVMDWIYDMCHT
ncbi:MAG TPA: hypothetical protein VGO47_02215, partial [Chlamydiales bacterium]|nr:hypothetical protein [Chlamydiales bacterium]